MVTTSKSKDMTSLETPRVLLTMPNVVSRTVCTEILFPTMNPSDWTLLSIPLSPTGAQTDIFLEPGSATPTTVPPSPMRHKMPSLIPSGPRSHRVTGTISGVLLEYAHRFMMMVYSMPLFVYYYARI